ncbi:hypothetical protein EVJ58_g5173 [Rhodofomes roseus]|uniref:Integrase catalytic domain-containing protein n=1 Tax=Rhodofomes roseus TaxID=34475 RepID=A0A4Y9YCY8_9APHY|nr:hypothetical protein EVJ58_g5173 [Rhodofomes roseus]
MYEPPFYYEWLQRNQKAQGSICLCLTSCVKAAVKSKATSKALYDKQTPAGVYKEFRTAINAQIPPNEHPNPTFANITAAFDKLAGKGINIPAPLRVLNALPSWYDTVVTTILQAKELTEMKINYVWESVVIAYEQGGKQASSSQSVKKISAVKRKHGEPNFNQQQQRQDGSSSSGAKEGQGKGKVKSCANQGDHTDSAHLASQALIVGPTTSKVVEIAPLGSKSHTVTTCPAKTGHSKNAHQWLKSALELTKDINVPGTSQHLTTLAEVVDNSARIKEYLSDSESESRASKRSRHGSEVGHAINVIMDGTYNSYDKDEGPTTQDPLDWGSDGQYNIDDELANAAGLGEDFDAGYYILYYDDYTSNAWTVNLRNKSAAITATHQFLAMAKNQYGKKVKKWMSDAGGEYKSEVFDKMLKDEGIQILQSLPHTPQENGRVERLNRTIMDKAEAMRHVYLNPGGNLRLSTLFISTTGHQSDPDQPSGSSSGSDDDEVEELLMAQLCREGGVGLVNMLLAKVLPLVDQDSPKSSIRKWTFRDISKLPKEEQEKWKAACCREELEALHKRGVYELVDHPKGRRVTKNHWVFDVKTDGRKKARLVAKGYSQIEGLDYDQVFSPVIHFETVCLILTLAALKGMHISGLDVHNAYLYGKLNEEIYMEQPEHFKAKGQEHRVLRLLCALYGLKQAGLAWWRTLNESLKELGFTRLVSDAGIFIYKTKDGHFVLVIVYVDDALFCGKDKSLVAKLKNCFMKNWECHNLGNVKEFLCMRITRKGDNIHLDQTAYLETVLQRCGMQNAKSAPTPLPVGHKPEPHTCLVDHAL